MQLKDGYVVTVSFRMICICNDVQFVIKILMVGNVSIVAFGMIGICKVVHLVIKRLMVGIVSNVVVPITSMRKCVENAVQYQIDGNAQDAKLQVINIWNDVRLAINLGILQSK